MLVGTKGRIVKVLSRLDMIWLINHKLGALRMMITPGDLKDLVKLNIKDDVGSCKGAYPESFIKIGHDLTDKA